MIPPIEISDHAVLRYLERAYGMDIEAVKTEMIHAVEPAIAFGASVVIAHGVKLVIREGKYVVTALPKNACRQRLHG